MSAVVTFASGRPWSGRKYPERWAGGAGGSNEVAHLSQRQTAGAEFGPTLASGRLQNEG